MERWKPVVAVLVVMVGIIATTGVAQINAAGLEGTECTAQYEGTIMKPDKETLRKWIEAYYSAPQTYLIPEIRQWIEQHPRISFSLLDHLEYDPAERNQGYCGNCWVWTGTGILGIALDVGEGIKDRLSVQYFTSCWSDTDWACCGGSLDWFADWYQTKGFAIPWSNANAHWQDGTQMCIDQTSVPCGTISTSPNYPIINCVDTRITTHGVGQDQAIANIKNVLHQNKAVWFAYYLPTGDDWNNFYDFWNNQSENAIWNPDFSCGHTWIELEGGGHAVLCVGYDDTDPDNPYWIMLNSWGTTGGRPNGLFYLDMNMNYDCYFIMDGVYYYSFYWQTLDVTFNQPPNIPSAPTGPDDGTFNVSYTFTASTTDLDGDQVAFKFDWGDGTQSNWTSYVDSGSSASRSHSWSTEGTYNVKVKAKDTHNAESGWSAGHPITIRAIVLEVDPSSLDLGELGKTSTKVMTFRAYNAGAGTLRGDISVDRNWITVSPTSFEGNDNTISVTVSTEGLTESHTPYTGTITVSSNGGTKTIEVSVIVIPTGVVVYPNPFSLARHTKLTFWGTGVPYAKIRIFNLVGEMVKTLDEIYGASEISWDGRNEKGDKLARGIYIYVAKDSTGKIAVVK